MMLERFVCHTRHFLERRMPCVRISSSVSCTAGRVSGTRCCSPSHPSRRLMQPGLGWWIRVKDQLASITCFPRREVAGQGLDSIRQSLRRIIPFTKAIVRLKSEEHQLHRWSRQGFTLQALGASRCNRREDVRVRAATRRNPAHRRVLWLAPCWMACIFGGGAWSPQGDGCESCLLSPRSDRLQDHEVSMRGGSVPVPPSGEGCDLCSLPCGEVVARVDRLVARPLLVAWATGCPWLRIWMQCSRRNAKREWKTCASR